VVEEDDGTFGDDDSRNDIPCRTMPNGDFKCTCDDDYVNGYVPEKVPGFTSCADAEALCPVVGELRTGCIKTCGLCGWKHTGSRFGHVGGGERVDDDAEVDSASADATEDAGMEEYGTTAVEAEGEKDDAASSTYDDGLFSGDQPGSGDQGDQPGTTNEDDDGSYTSAAGTTGTSDVADAVNDAVSAAVESLVPDGEAGSFSAAVEAAVAAAVSSVVPDDAADSSTAAAIPPVAEAPVDVVADDSAVDYSDASDTTAAVEPVVDAAVEPVVDAAVEPVVDAAVEPVVDAAVEPVVDAAVEPVVDAAATDDAVAVDDTVADDYEIDYSTIDEKQARSTVQATESVSAPHTALLVSGFALVAVGAVMIRRRLAAQHVQEEECANLDAVSLTPSSLDVL